MSVSLQSDDFDISAELDALVAGRTSIGAAVTFTGLTRDMVADQRIMDMTLEHYPQMAQAELERIEAEALTRWPLLEGTRIIHRFGTLVPGDRIVLVITLSAHRQCAFEAAEFIMDFVKLRAPFWKKERTAEGDNQWVDAKDADKRAIERWQTPNEQ
ncbi:molybdenum cofactor biosynthesis protein MoaE [uncultured Cohaesibacter sp.]|uniref:molybdenum cofactor biosynthesis protein MoaE n=1 Tax=uncultured Cohaesibacter sp. TaxID=1002546 RepID=UPI00292F7B29|nr:molybdenum cofactor biosynthesis protein MoaE [uncultured Cohaesibacter sp.]